ncbi:MAG: long-chain-fatty-acid--CoA ligase [Rhodospirillales bacterium]|nr:long-chain-fatty-acid--CoA ligase [Rhodospirillales bacterium]
MLGLMQQRELLISSFLDYAEAYHPTVEVVSRLRDGALHRIGWGGIAARARKLAKALQRFGLRRGDRVATLAWNTHRHLELFFGVTGSGIVLHTVNPRLFADQLRYILNHADSSVLCFDVEFAPLVADLAPHLPSVHTYVALGHRDELPDHPLPNLVAYEDLLDAEDADFAWPRFDENSASSLCYTSGTTGNPKGVLYSHRSTVLHTLSLMAVDTMAISARETILPCAPLFHVNCWGIPYAAAGTGAKLVLPGSRLDGASLWELLRDEGVTFAAAVPTVWLTLFAWMEQQPGLDPAALKLRRVLSGGTAVPRLVIETLRDRFGATLQQAWGMTELSPLGTVGNLTPRHEALDAEAQMALRLKQGRTIYGIELRVVDEAGTPLPRDGSSVGLVQARGPWVLSGYFKGVGGQAVDADGWFGTGDVGTLDADGFLTITDRAKDVVKSGGEWISSIELENLAVGHPAVREAAVIAARHPRWQERPLLLVTCKDGRSVTRTELLAFLEPKVAKWWLPDDVICVDALPHTATGKVQKAQLRRDYADWLERG